MIEVVNAVCDRCGKCCFMFIHQIHYKLSQIDQIKPNQINHPIFNWYWNNKEQFLREEDGKKKYFVPTKEEFKKMVIIQESQTILTPARQANECIFLAWDEQGYPECIIQEFKPQMCRDYPDVKGGACINHKERYFSRPFYEFQKQTVDMPIRVLKEFFRGKITDERAYDILTFLMDYGRFNKQLVQDFFQQELGMTPEDFGKNCTELLNYNLISLYEDQQGVLIEGISEKEIERVVDEIMKERGWTL